jgi:hypothetical protein
MNSQTEKSKVVRKWMADNQGKHLCGCGCGQPIAIKIHHHARGIPSFVNGHSSRLTNPVTGKCGSANPNFRQGRYVNGYGYILVLMPGPGRSRYVFEHRLVMEHSLGRKLRRDEVVHHKNGDKTDNRIRNLELMSNGQHTRLHASRNEVGFGRWKRRRMPISH